MTHRSAIHEYVAEMRPELGAKLVHQALSRGHKLPAILSRAEVQACIKAGDSERDALIVKTFYATGVRISELAHFVKADIRTDDEYLFVREGKDAKDRLVCVDPETLQRLVDYTRHLKESDPVFNIGVRQIHRVVVDCGRRIGLVEKYAAMGRRFSPHALRHCFATHFHEDGLDVLSLKQLLGHEYLETTEMYVEVALAHVKAAYHRALEQQRKKVQTPVTEAFSWVEADEAPPTFADIRAQYRTCWEHARRAGRPA